MGEDRDGLKLLRRAIEGWIMELAWLQGKRPTKLVGLTEGFHYHLWDRCGFGGVFPEIVEFSEWRLSGISNDTRLSDPGGLAAGLCHLSKVELSLSQKDHPGAKAALHRAESWAVRAGITIFLARIHHRWAEFLLQMLETNLAEPEHEGLMKDLSDHIVAGLSISRRDNLGLTHIDLSVAEGHYFLHHRHWASALDSANRALRGFEVPGGYQIIGAIDEECCYHMGEADAREVRAEAFWAIFSLGSNCNSALKTDSPLHGVDYRAEALRELSRCAELREQLGDKFLPRALAMLDAIKEGRLWTQKFSSELSLR